MIRDFYGSHGDYSKIKRSFNVPIYFKIKDLSEYIFRNTIRYVIIYYMNTFFIRILKIQSGKRRTKPQITVI